MSRCGQLIIWITSAQLCAAYVDPRDVVRSGNRIAGGFNSSEYYNQPQAIQLKNGSWLLVLTNAAHTEGQTNQRVVSRLHPSPSLSGINASGWLPDVNIEYQPYGPSAGWVVPLYAPELDRIYAIYTFNANNITRMPDGSVCHCQLVGGSFMRWSDDAGASWSTKRLEVCPACSLLFGMSFCFCSCFDIFICLLVRLKYTITKKSLLICQNI